MREIDVYYNDIKAGVLREQYSGRGYMFQYDGEYLKGDYPAISLSLPKRSEAYESSHLFSFFANMIPEGANRGVVCRTNRIDEKDYFGILAAMSDKDFMGAINIRSRK